MTEKSLDNLQELANSTKEKFVLICIDAADWNLLYELVLGGELPNLKEMIENGSWGSLLSPTCHSVPEWTTLSTGKFSDRHGNPLDFYIDGRHVNSTDIGSKRIWNLLSESGKKVGVYRWLVTWPLEEVNGFMISDFLAQNKEIVYPKELEEKLIEYELTYDRGTLQGESIETIVYLLEKYDLDFVAIGDRSIYQLEHEYLIYWRPELYNITNTKEIENGKNVIIDAWKRFDDLLGKIKEIYGEDTTIFIVSDHGLRLNEEYFYEIHIDALIQYLEKFGIFPCDSEFVNNVYEIYVRPTELNSIYFCINPEDKDSTIEILKNFRYTDSNLTFFKDYSFVDGRLVSTFNNPTMLNQSQFTFDIPITLPNNSVKEIRLFRKNLDHTAISGIIIAKGPAIKKNYIIQENRIFENSQDCRNSRECSATYPSIPNNADITPTILYLMGHKIPFDMDGRVLSEMIKEHYLTSNPIIYTTESSQKQKITVDTDIEVNETRISHIEEKLKSLGYVV